MQRIFALLIFSILLAGCSEDESISKPEVFLLTKVERIESEYFHFEFYTYDDRGRLIQSKDSSELINPYVLNKVYSYDPSGILKRISYDGSLDEDFEHQNGFLVKSTTSLSELYYSLYFYDEKGRVKEIQEFGPFSGKGIIIQNKKLFTYDVNDNIVSKKIMVWDPITDEFELSASYTYEGYDSHRNPYFERHNFPWFPVSRNNPAKLTMINSQNQTLITDYQYSYNENGLPSLIKEIGPVRTNAYTFFYRAEK